MLEFLRNNWLWIAIALFFVWMHRSGAGCGGHSGHAGHGDGANRKPREGGPGGDERNRAESSGHDH